jgi:NADH dehydrogenase FAD-containing subunit
MATTRKQRVLVLGGGYAGTLAAARVARERSAEVTLVDALDAAARTVRGT